MCDPGRAVIPDALDIAIVIPTRDRPATLERTLAALALQDLDGVRAELIVVDNGSPDAAVARAREAVARHPWTARLIELGHANVSDARNQALAATSAPAVLLTNDDVTPATSAWIAGHAAALAEVPRGDAVVGPVEWAPEIAVTPVMRWLSEGGHSHDYSGLRRGLSDPGWFYANNLSIARDAVVEAGGFDPRLGRYGWQEYDLALRLAARGMRLHFRPDLAAHHHHRYDLPASLARMRAIGRASVVFNAINAGQPGLRSPHPARWKVRLGALASPLLTRVPVPEHTPRPMAAALFALTHAAALARGFADGAREA